MDRISRQVINYIKAMEQKAKQMHIVKHLKKKLTLVLMAHKSTLLNMVLIKVRYYDRDGYSFTYDC